jgi:hypothetical protein
LGIRIFAHVLAKFRIIFVERCDAFVIFFGHFAPMAEYKGGKSQDESGDAEEELRQSKWKAKRLCKFLASARGCVRLVHLITTLIAGC